MLKYQMKNNLKFDKKDGHLDFIMQFHVEKYYFSLLYIFSISQYKIEKSSTDCQIFSLLFQIILLNPFYKIINNCLFSGKPGEHNRSWCLLCSWSCHIQLLLTSRTWFSGREGPGRPLLFYSWSSIAKSPPCLLYNEKIVKECRLNILFSTNYF